MDFYDLPLNDDLLDALDVMHFEQCTPIQEKTIPVILEGRDVIGIAQTGTGKTAAYLLPILHKLHTQDYPADAVKCIIMSPTRELAQQIDQALQGFSYFMPISSVAIYGGNDGIRYEQERKGLQLGADIVIATPGRLISHLNLENADFSKVSFFVLDEADRMLDMGFSDDIMQIEKALPKERQTILFSATMPNKILQLAEKILDNPVEVKIAVSQPAEKIVQHAYICKESQKLRLIKHIFQDKKMDRVIVFSSSKSKVKELTAALKKMHLNADEMHSDLEQKQRDSVMLAFKNRNIDILVATDIVARGIDIDDIQMVINYDVPHDAEDYVHRIGRTARANRDGEALTFVNEKDQVRFAGIERFLKKEIEKIALPKELGEQPEYKGAKQEPDKKRGDRRGGRNRKSRQASKAPKATDAQPQNAQERKHRSRKRRRKPAGGAAAPKEGVAAKPKETKPATE